jgi:hypothetical protein
MALLPLRPNAELTFATTLFPTTQYEAIPPCTLSAISRLLSLAFQLRSGSNYMITEPHARLQHQESNAISSYKKTKPRTNKISALAIQTKHYSQLRNPCRIKLNSKAKEEEEEIQLRCRKPLKLETTIA